MHETTSGANAAIMFIVTPLQKSKTLHFIASQTKVHQKSNNTKPPTPNHALWFRCLLRIPCSVWLFVGWCGIMCPMWHYVFAVTHFNVWCGVAFLVTYCFVCHNSSCVVLVLSLCVCWSFVHYEVLVIDTFFFLASENDNVGRK